MNRSEKDYRDARAAYRQLPLRQKLGHIWLYHKWPILLSLTAVLVLGSVIYRVLTRKDRVLYLGLANVAIGSDLEQALGPDYLTARGQDPGKTEILFYRDLFLSDDAEGEAHKSAYASRVKLMASIESRQLDALLMSRQAYDLLSAQGYLLPLETLCAGEPGLLQELEPLLAESEVILADNGIDYLLDEAESHQTETETVVNGLRLDSLPLFAEAFSQPLYLGFVANTPRSAACLDYLRYLLQAQAPGR